MKADKPLENQNHQPRGAFSATGFWAFLTFLGFFDGAIFLADHVIWSGTSKVWHI